MRRPNKKKVVERCVDAMDTAAKPLPVEPASPTKVKSAPPSDKVEPPATPSKAELPACASLVAKYAQLEAQARTAFAAAERNFAIELRIYDCKNRAIDKVMSKKNLTPRQIQFQETKLDKASAQLTSARMQVLVTNCELLRRCCMTSMAKVEQRDATLRSVRRRLRRRTALN